VRKLHLGCGANILQGWLNTDGFSAASYFPGSDILQKTMYLNVCRPFPIQDNSFDYVFHEHLIEHLTYQQGQFLLAECLRVLKPGGTIRVATPDLATFISLYGANVDEDRKRFIDEYVRMNSEVWSDELKHVVGNKAVFVINHCVRAWGHLFIYDAQTLLDAMRAAGFTDLVRKSPQQSDDPNLGGIELRKDMVGIYDALIVEGRNPQH
jgi:predicted SAM-dependent methyltransferase